MGRVFFNTRVNIQDQDGAYALLASDSGKTLMLSSTDGACEITLPTVAVAGEGWFCKFVVKEDTPTGVITIKAEGTIIDLVMKDSAADAASSTIGSAATNILVAIGALQGDYINIFTDGITWYAESLSGGGDKITTS